MVRLVFEPRDSTLLVDFDCSKPLRCFGADFGCDDGDRRAARTMKVNCLAVIELVDVIRAQYQDEVRLELADKAAVAVDRIGIALMEATIAGAGMGWNNT